MKITVFTSNEARHIAFLEALAPLCDSLSLVWEAGTLFPGAEKGVYRKSAVMEEYFSHVHRAQEAVFGSPRFLPPNVRVIGMKLGDLARVPMEWLRPVLTSDLFIVFGASFIRSPLVDELVQRKAINIHMGVSPFYRGNSCNFWALHDRRADLVGATIHLLTAGLDSGPILFHALPAVTEADPFDLGMLAVRAAHRGIVEHIRRGDLLSLSVAPQSKVQELRYTRGEDFTDDIAAEYLRSMPSPREVHAELLKRNSAAFHQSFIDSVA